MAGPEQRVKKHTTGGAGEGVKIMAAAFLIIAIVIGTLGWITASIVIFTFDEYLKEKRYTPPTSEEVEACVKKAVWRLLLRES